MPRKPIDQPPLFPSGQDPNANSAVESTKPGSAANVPVHKQKPAVIPTKSPETLEPRRYSWIMLYEARLAKLDSQPIPAPGARRGRPPRKVPLKKLHLYMTASDEETLSEWQRILTKVFGNKPSLGETAAVVATVLMERYKMLNAEQVDFNTFADLAQFLLTTDERKDGQ